MVNRTLTPEDLFHLTMVGRIAIHPGGRHAICEMSHLLPESNETVTHLWHVDTNGGDRTPFTWAEGSQVHPAYAPDGRFLAFIGRKTGEKGQIYVMRTDGGEAVRVTNEALGVQSFKWHPRGTSIVYQSPVDKAGKPGESARARYTSDVRVIERTWYRLDGVGYFGGQRTHLSVVDVTPFMAHRSLQSEPVRDFTFPTRAVTDGPFDVQDYDLHPDGRHVVFVSNLDEDADETQHRFAYETEISDGGEGHLLASPIRIPLPIRQAQQVAYSPTGEHIAVLGHNRPHGQYSLSQMFVYERESNTSTLISDGWELSFGNAVLSDFRADVDAPLVWSEHGRYVYTIATKYGTSQLIRVDVETRTFEWLTQGEHTVLTFDLSRDSATAAMLIETATKPADLFVQGIPLSGEDSTTPRRLTDINGALLEKAPVNRPKRFYVNCGETELEGWVMLPEGPVPEGGFPAVLQVHGGPVAAYGESFFLEFQLLVQAGIAVLFCNPRGSLGYGQAYCCAIRGRWGTVDFEDTERFVDAVTAAYPIDQCRLAIAGGSYGGFMAAWAIGHTSRYQSAVVMRACVNEYSMFGTCDVGFMDVEDLPGAPWEYPDAYVNLSPIAFADKMKAKVLILHAENDLRCPIEQAEQLYAALKYHRVPVTMVRFPEESHGMSRNGKPWHRVARLEYIVTFLKQTLQA
ncbi:S9 family peptidase [Alicyclobacillus fastidiosus]|uniref:S9 family peptidase n=1 Tax=Alicyclobacillus fastidiosus TaxID=392011 RepID=A0ABY6ZF72_9BACL|nr:S9 family peptidase [Alicyclobacillus fastidiosus]WAH40866.1 S9 family peptidase [Alicyclobacillus fastidiosus]GMA62354.1 putative peptidase YuxL [Alicyclobacillus fastidiosus]